MVIRFLVALVIATSIAACSSDKAEIAGDTAQAQTSEAGPDSAVATTQSTHVYTKTVRAVRSDGSFEIAMRFDSIKVDATVRSRKTGAVLVEQHYSSADSMQRTQKEFMQFSALLGEEVTVYVSPRGAVMQVGDSAVYATFQGQEMVPFPNGKIDSNGNWANTMTTPINDLFTEVTEANYHVVSLKKINNRTLASIQAEVKGGVKIRPLPKDVPFSVKLISSSFHGSSRSLLDAKGGFTISKKNERTLTLVAKPVSTKGEKKDLSLTQVSRYEIELLR